MTNTAILIVGQRTGAGEPMLMGIPSATSYDWYYRIRTGDRGRGAAWNKIRKTALPDLTASISYPTIEIALTDRDITMSEAGRITDINIKAMKALGGANQLTTQGPTMLSEYERYQSVKTETEPVKAEIPTVEPVAAVVSIPDISWAESYVNRKVAGELTDFEILDVAMKNHENVLITGPAGSGKTICAMAYAAARGYNYVNVSSHSGVEHSQLFGRWVPTADGSFRFQYGPVAEIVRDGGVLLINEVNFMPAAVKTVLFSLLDHRREIQILDNRGEVIKAHPNLLIIADMNPGYRGTKPLNEAENDRYSHKLDFPYDPAIEGKLIKSKSLLSLAGRLRAAFDREELSTPVSTRSLVAFMDNATSLGVDYAVYSFINGFSEGERSAVKLNVDTLMSAIRQDLGLDSGVTYQPDETFAR